MKNIGLLFILVLTGCNHSAILKPEDTKVSRSAEMQQEKDHMDSYNQGYAKGWDEAKHQDKVQKFQDDLYREEGDMFN